MKLMLKHLSSCYMVKQILEEDMGDVYSLCKGNPIYYKYMKSEPTIENMKEDLTVLPPGKAIDDKYFVGFYKENLLIAIMDLIIEYPNDNTVFIGLFMLNKEYQGLGIGTKIINDTLNFLKKEGCGCARLGFVKGNLQSQNFWTKNKFIHTGIDVEKENYTVVVMQRDL